jgi:steroid delta-isomerase-like uncharacterized protein
MKPVYLLSAMLLVTGITNAQTSNTMSAIQKNKEIVRRLYEEALNKRNLNLLEELVSVDYSGIAGKKGPDAIKESVAPLIAAFPDIQWKIEDLIGENDKVTVRWGWQGTQQAPYLHFPPTGKTVANTGIAVYELKNGKIAGAHLLTDRLGFLQGLGVLPTDLALLPKKQAYKERVSFIDKFRVPAGARQAFYERMNINRSLIKTLPGFIEDAAYEYTSENGDLICVTVALWQSREALNKAREVVQEQYKKEGVDPAEMLKRLNIVADRGVYEEIGNN